MAAEPTVRVIEYAVSLLPPEHIDAQIFEVTVSWRGRGKWAIMRGGRICLGRNGEWDYEMQPSSREDDWLAEHRWDLDEALAKAKEIAPTVRINGHTAQEIYDEVMSRGR